MPIQVRREDEIAWLRLDSAERANAIDDADLSALRRAAVQLGDVPPRVLVIEASGADFCTGLHLEPGNPMLEDIAPLVARGDKYALQERLVGWRAALDTLGRLPTVTIAAIRGRCVGLGLELALAADIRVGAEQSRYALPGAATGLTPWGGGIVRLTRLVGRTRATDLAILGRELDAPTALAWGILTRVVADPDATATALAQGLRAGALTGAQQTVLALRAAEELTDRSFAFEAEAAARSLCRHLDEGLRTWRETRSWKPVG